MENTQTSFETTEKMTALLLCDPTFLSNFDKNYIANLNKINWTPEMGEPHQLHGLPSNHFDIILVDETYSLNYSSFICCLRVLKNNGIIVMPKKCHLQFDKFKKRVAEFVEIFPSSDEIPILILSKVVQNKSYEVYEQELSYFLETRAFDMALQWIDKMEILSPFAIEPIMYRCNIYQTLGLVEGVEASWASFQQRFNHQGIEIYKALSVITAGDYCKGFKMRQPLVSDARRTKTPPKAVHQIKKWQGQNLLGKHFVIWTEFGLGDELMFAQLAYALKKQLNVRKITLIAQTPVVKLLKSHLDIDVVIDSKKIDLELDDSFDYWSFPHDIMAYIDLPFYQIVKRHPYLFIDQQSIDNAKKKISQMPDKLNIGIVWRGNPTHENDAFRSIHQPELLRLLFDIEGANWYCLQKECNLEEKKLLAEYQIPNLAKNAKTLWETATYLVNLDYLVTVDTSVAHLAGALGVKTLLLLPFIGDWRWGYGSANNLWYPHITSIRIDSLTSSFEKVIHEVGIHLNVLIHNHLTRN